MMDGSCSCHSIRWLLMMMGALVFALAHVRVFSRQILPEAMQYIESVPLQFVQQVLTGQGRWNAVVKVK